MPSWKDRRSPNRKPPRSRDAGRGSERLSQPGKKRGSEGGAGAQSGAAGQRGRASTK
ncbi:MAG TPA: hypothetical protein VGQ86_10680 [Candidatus Limnocylindria bacterium]|jgi:hypothetical protein|nr:hypothetical protein [Candidatus Limnocylindria bacterium]